MSAPIKTLVGLFQEAHYDPSLFRSWIKRHPASRDWKVFHDRVALRWTLKARLLSFAVLFLSFGGIAAFLPQVLLFAARLLRPFERMATQWMAWRAGRALQGSGIRTVIGITGSYGKTTTKEILTSILSTRFRVHATPENVNTLLGVAGWIAKQDFRPDAILVVEMGAYCRGDISRLCRLVRPTIGILTGINEAHLERFGTIENTKEAKSELFDCLPSFSGIGFWNQSSPLAEEAVSERALQWRKRHIKLVPYTAAGLSSIRLVITGVQETWFGLRVEKISDQPWVVEAKVGLLGQHNILALSAAIAVADTLGLSSDEIQAGLKSIRPIKRRLAPAYAPGGQLIIDDSYNITLDGVRAAVEALRHIRRRRIGVFAGIPEAGSRAIKLNQMLGRIIAPEFQVLLLRETPVWEAVEAGLREAGWNPENLFRYTKREEMEQLFKAVLKPGDLLYFSAYDWPAIYL